MAFGPAARLHLHGICPLRLNSSVKKWILLLVVCVAVVAGAYLYINQPHRSVGDAEGISIQADSLFVAFSTQEALANERYLNAVLRVEGTVKSVERNAENKMVIVLDAGDPMFGINCTLDQEASIAVGQSCIIKGICTGYLADVVITQGILEKQP